MITVEPPLRFIPSFVRWNEYLGEEETATVIALVASVEPRVVFEFGVNLGKTARAILDIVPSIEKYVGIDVPPDFRTRLACQRAEVPFEAGYYAAADERFAVLIRPQGSASLQHDDLEPADAVFIDGDHSFEGVMADSLLARAILRPGGIIIWHDYANPAVGVTAALDGLVEQSEKLFATTNTMGVAAKRSWPICHVRGTWLAYMRDLR